MIQANLGKSRTSRYWYLLMPKNIAVRHDVLAQLFRDPNVLLRWKIQVPRRSLILKDNFVRQFVIATFVNNSKSGKIVIHLTVTLNKNVFTDFFG